MPPPVKAWEYDLVPLHCATAGAIDAAVGEVVCLNAVGQAGWRVVAGTVHQVGHRWFVLCEREK